MEKTITIFTIPKAFIREHIKTIQTNAIKSWRALGFGLEVILIGDDKGVEQVARELKVKHISNVKRNKLGTPLLDSAFSLVREKAKSNILCYVNSDIIFFSDFLKIFKFLPREEFLIVGRRWNIDIEKKINFENKNWEKLLKKKIKKIGRICGGGGSDYFIFKKNSFKDFPGFAVGRVKWDNWMIYEALRKKMLVIDATEINPIVHQNHDYSHQINRGRRRTENIEAKENIKLTKKMKHIFTLKDVRWKLTKAELKKKNFTFNTFLRYLKYFKDNPEILPRNVGSCKFLNWTAIKLYWFFWRLNLRV